MRACGESERELSYENYIADSFVLQQFEALLVRSQLRDELRSRRHTLFTPYDGAFVDDPPPFWQRMTGHVQWSGHLRDFVRGHISAEALSNEALTDGRTVTMINGQTHTVSRPAGRHPRLSDILVIASTTASDADLHMLNAALAPAWVDRTIVDVLREDGRFTILTGLLDSVPTGPFAPATPLTSYARRLNRVDDRGLTLFAPTDDALAHLRDDCISSSSCQSDVRRVLDAQVVERVFSRRYSRSGTLTSLGGTSLDWEPEAETVQCTGRSQATPVSDELYARNGIIHPVDSLVCPLVE